MLTLNDGRNELWQWDTGRKLTVDAECSQVHFSNKVFGRSIDVDVLDGVASIPDILLQTDKELAAWAFVGTAENGYTKISKVFKVNRRNKPADYVFTPPEQTTLAEIMERIDDLEAIQDPDAIKNAVDDYLANNPIKVQETDPTVPNWAKEKEKPKYTADEVGALSKEELSGAVNEALAQAKESGEFDGKDGADGKDGKTPVKGIDYFDGQPGKDGEPGKDYVLTSADKEEIAELASELVEVPEPSGGIEVTGATVGQTVKISAVDENGVPTAWEPVDFPSGGGGGGSNAFKLLASVEPITEPVKKISVAIEEDGISEIYLVGKIKQAEDNSYSYAYIGVNNRSVSFNFGIKTTVEHLLTYHGVILEGGHWLMTMRVNQHWGQEGEYILTAPQGGFDNYPEEVNEVCIEHSGGGMLAIGTYFEVWGR